MNSARLNDWLQTLAAVGVILSLIFVGLELRQTRQVATADVYQQRTALQIEAWSAALYSEQLQMAEQKLSEGAVLSEQDTNLLWVQMILKFSYWENVHFQYQTGLMPAEQWSASRRSIENMFRNNPVSLDYWAVERKQVRQSFAEEVDMILEESVSLK